MSKEWEDLFPTASINKMPREVSDHNPLILYTDVNKPLNYLGFKFELAWIIQPDFKDLVKKIWDKPCHAESAFDRIQIKLKRFKQYFKGWGFNLQGARRKRKSEIQSSLKEMEEEEEELGPLPYTALCLRANLTTELLKILEEEELYWFKRSHETWLHKGDNNTDYFHRVANGRKRKNAIHSLQDEDRTIEGDPALLDHATKYYKKLFGPAEDRKIPLNPSLFENVEKLPEDDNRDLCRPFTEEEIKNALDQMEHNKAAGPDKIPIEFYQSCWDIIKIDIIELFNDFHRGNLDVSRLNYGIITLLPKVNEANKIQQFRPICLLNCLYKWITKVLTVRISPYAEKLISREQTAFMKGRNIMSGIMALHEILHETKRQKKIGVVLKLDFEKAYDKVDWNFLFDCLRYRGFCDKWLKWIKEVVSGGSLNIKLNNQLGPYFVSHKGVRQGDPLSPILFNFVADCLTRMVHNAQNNGMIKGLAENLIPNGVAILQYADDTIICLENSIETARNTKLLLYLYEIMSGLKINFMKSEIVLIHGDNDLANQYAEIFNCQVGLFPIKYLGVPVSPSRLHVADWIPLHDKNGKKLDIWKGGSMSIAGRTTLINSTLSSSFIYHMSLYLLPQTSVDTLDRQRRSFFWQGGGQKRKYHLVKWELICRSKKKGGLGIKDIRKMNISLLCKWWWKLENESGLWQDLIQAKYIKQDLINTVKPKFDDSPIWKDLMKIRHIYLRGRKILTQNGAKTLFWTDSWLDDIPLSSKQVFYLKSVMKRILLSKNL